MNQNNTQDFVKRLLGQLSPEDQMSFFDYTNQIQSQGQMKMKEDENSANVRRKQAIVDSIFNGGQTQGVNNGQ